ncbi:type 1 glutamine amidotransferase family protein [Bdellovibrio sp. HCB-162]|uniref:type 1 glutamine amidotransferase family protein n=1 Tax=Bdellovibrio sp. HCB-162 TaxID=3394234 RepID=UPI0039BC58C6
MEKSLVVYLPEGFADWEGAFLLPELRQAKKKIIIASSTGESISSIGGMTVVPERALSGVAPDTIEGLILIGSDSWMDANQNQNAIELADALLSKGVLVAAICGATVALARAGLLNNRRHTSNDLGMLKQIVPSYGGEKFYLKSLAVTDKNLITATGVAPIEFTREIMAYLNMYTPEYRKHWFELYKNAVMPPLEFWGQT